MTEAKVMSVIFEKLKNTGLRKVEEVPRKLMPYSTRWIQKMETKDTSKGGDRRENEDRRVC